MTFILAYLYSTFIHLGQNGKKSGFVNSGFVKTCDGLVIGQNLVKKTLLLPLLARIADEFPENMRLKSIIGKIIANISLFPETHKFLFSSGWVSCENFLTIHRH